jgi:hypothetical protein
MNTTTTQTATKTHIDAVRASYSNNTAVVKKILSLDEEKYFEIVTKMGFQFLEKHKLYDELKANPLFWNFIRMRICKAERLFISRFHEPEKRQRLFIAYTHLVEFEVLHSMITKQNFNSFLKILRNENVG